jgi:hypothetical protein
MGARAYRYLSLYDPAPGCLIEIGSERGEGSTAFLDAYAKQHGLRFYTADIDPDVYRGAQRITRGARLAAGTALLKRVGQVSVAYMDGFDWIPEGLETEGWITDQQRRYQALGRDMNNANCQAEHLAEARLLAERAADRCAVILDDTWCNGSWSGKGALAVPFLESQGFRVVDTDEPEGTSLGYVVMRRW